MTAQEYFKQEWGGFTKATLHGEDTILEISMEDLYKTMEGYKYLAPFHRRSKEEILEEYFGSDYHLLKERDDLQYILRAMEDYRNE